MGSLPTLDLPPWKPLSRPLSVALAIAVPGVGLLARACEGFIPVLDHANLAFHEFGHPFFGLFGETLALYGGTLFQFVFPLAAAGSGFLRREVPAFVAGLAWALQNLFNVARYMADARAQELPLVGGGEHDWFHILSRWNVLAKDVTYAARLERLAWIGLLSVSAWLVFRKPEEE